MSSQNNIPLTIDGETLLAPVNSTIQQVLETLENPAPLICYHTATTPEGICRQCVVEIEGWRTLAPSCVTTISEGMVIHTESERVMRARRTILEMLAASVDLSEASEIISQMEAYNADPKRFPGAKTRAQVEAGFRPASILDDNPFYVRDYQKCLLCWRCVQACGDDMQYSYALSVGGRGFESKIATFYEAPMPETTCVFCGNCVAVCPTNALKGKTEFFLEQGLDYDHIRLEKRKARKK